MSDSIKIRARLENGQPVVKMLINHPMETGRRQDKQSGRIVPAHYIQELTCQHNGKVVLKANWGAGIAKNPYLSFGLRSGEVGDTIKISWIDNKGGTDSREVLLAGRPD